MLQSWDLAIRFLITAELFCCSLDVAFCSRPSKVYLFATILGESGVGSLQELGPTGVSFAPAYSLGLFRAWGLVRVSGHLWVKGLGFRV